MKLVYICNINYRKKAANYLDKNYVDVFLAHYINLKDAQRALQKR